MHIKEFIQKTDDLIEKMTEVQAKNCLHQIARKTDESIRENFLQQLQDGLIDFHPDDNTLSITRNLPNIMSDEKVMEKIYFFEEAFNDIEEHVLTFSANEYETYNEYHWDSDWEISHSDPQGIGRIIEDAVLFAYECVNDLRYKQALFIFDLILNVTAESYSEDSGEIYEINLQEMIDENIVKINGKKMAINILYAKYQSTRKNKRAETLYEYFSYPYFNEIHIEDIFSTGREEVKDFDEFIEIWIKFLMDKSGAVAARLLKEAIFNYKGTEGLIEIARETKGIRPVLYLESINELEKIFEYEKITQLGIEAIKMVNPKLKIRGKIAIKTAQASFFTGKTELMHECWYETFVSSTNVVNYLRLFVNENVVSKYNEKVKERIEKIEIEEKKADEFSYPKRVIYCENEENSVDELTCKILHYFKYDFEKTKTWCENQNTLGWSGEFIWYGVRLIMLMLYDSKDQKKAIERISTQLSNKLGFSKSENLIFFADNAVLETDTDMLKGEKIFWNIFGEWKKYIPAEKISVDNYISWLQKIIDKRVVAIIDGKYRNKYEDIATLVAAIGEIRESRGEKFAKTTLIDQYHKKYPRHNAFRAKLREY